MGGGNVIYGDVLFLINFSMDFLVLFCCGGILHLKRRVWLLALSAAAGAVFAVLSLFMDSRAAVSVLNAAVSLLMCIIAYPSLRGGRYVKCVVMLYFMSLLLGGAVTACYSLLNRLTHGGSFNSDFAASSASVPLWVFVAVAAGCAVFSVVSTRIYGKSRETQRINVLIVANNKSGELSLLADSGNLLRDPIGGAPVILTTYEKLKPYLTEQMEGVFESCDLSGISDLGAMRRIRMIPASGINGHTILPAVVPEEIYVLKRNRKTRINAVVAVCADGVSYPGFDGVAPSCIAE